MKRIKSKLIRRKNSKKYILKPFRRNSSGDRIYFLNVGGADAILLESQGRFAMVDAGEDSDNPRGFISLAYRGTERYVLNAVKRIAGGRLDFAVGTHAHSDHLGGFDTVFLDPQVTVGKMYMKRYDESRICDFEVTHWDNKEVYEQTLNACRLRNIPVVFDLPKSFAFGSFKVTLLNREIRDYGKKVWENENSLGVLIEKDGFKAFLAGDINNNEGDEDIIAPLIGKVDLLKVGHHGSLGSTSQSFVNALKPDISIVTNSMKNLKHAPENALNSVNSAVYATTQCKGIVAEFTDDEIVLYKNLDKAIK